MPIFRRRTGLMGPTGCCSKDVVHCGYTATSHKTLKEKEEGAQNAKYSKNHQKTLENAPYNYAIFERIS